MENTVSKKVIYRQGDVMLIRVDSIPDTATDQTPDDRIVLAYGEVTGHAHAVYPEVMVIDGAPVKKLPAKIWDAGAERFLQVLEKTALKHEEHSAIELEPGAYKVIRQREYTDETERMERLVAD